jgi:7-carboxy-7-deazaguanine synthase (Cx14CxxC type)
MTYTVKEIYYTLQGEGVNTGRSAVFLRFAGCNLWSGREVDRATSICQFCDTDFVGADGLGGGVFETPEDLVDAVESHWPASMNGTRRFVVCTGGEPLLQMDTGVVDALHRRGFEIAVETNGTRPAPRGIDWICVSPKANADCVLCSGDELKLVFPQVGGEPEKYEHLDFQRFFLQPMDGPELERNQRMAIQYCLEHPRWELSLQTHKLLGLR